MKINAAAVQFTSTIGDKSTNLGKIKAWVEKIKTEQPSCNLIVFPELAVTGYDFQLDFSYLAEELDGESFHILADVAKQYGVFLVYGNIEKNQDREKPYNSVWLIGPDGEQIYIHRKIHLTNLENTFFTAGDSIHAVETQLGKIGLMICWDMAFPEVARSYAIQEVDLLIAPSAWEKPYQDPYVKFSMARALDNATPLITCNYVGETPSLQFFGASRIFDATGSELASLKEQEGYVYAEIDPNRTRLAREEFYTMLQERRSDLYLS